VTELTNFFSHNVANIVGGILVIIAILGVFKTRIQDWAARRLAKMEGRRMEEALGSIKTDDDLREGADKQERLARSKIESGNHVGVWELKEINRRKPISNVTKSALSRMLSRQDANSPAFDDILDILCSSR
jgi:hypothetical protein